MKIEDLCCPRIGPGYIKDGDKHNLFPQTMFPEETIAAAAANCMRVKAIE